MRDPFRAIADPTRRQLLRMLAEAGELALHEMAAHFSMGRTAVSKHLAILEEAGLVKSRKVGRETRYRLDATPLQEVQEWVSFYEQFWTQRIERLRQLLEEESQ
jgi:Predicted transcriptional regulators